MQICLKAYSKVGDGSPVLQVNLLCPEVRVGQYLQGHPGDPVCGLGVCGERREGERREGEIA